MRFRMARRLLLTTPLSVTDICFEVGYTSTGSFTSRFTQLIGLPPRLLRRQAHEFELPRIENTEQDPALPAPVHMKNGFPGWISAPPTFQGTIYVGLFSRPIPQGPPVSCTQLHAPGFYHLTNISDGVYYLMAAAFPMATDLQLYLEPGENILLAKSAGPIIIHNGYVAGDPNLVLRPPLLTDPPLVMALPLRINRKTKRY
ncbi:hypothetical protein KDK_82520 [Dictyobacter kobayashii]|uniref:HTH araC/xylS-type domain-containing protein n=1 Tax=Dictyobacter kobayashii TaxID=2014872 RepID=A0A402AZD0_9CHLR|nr:hypothetical protein KDK_82520 [Dictyobacter kobayashii]